MNALQITGIILLNIIAIVSIGLLVSKFYIETFKSKFSLSYDEAIQPIMKDGKIPFYHLILDSDKRYYLFLSKDENKYVIEECIVMSNSYDITATKRCADYATAFYEADNMYIDFLKNYSSISKQI